MYSVPVLVGLFLVFIFLTVKAHSLYLKETEVRGKADEVVNDLDKLEFRKTELQKKVDFMETERGKEEEMRSRFMVGKEGEGVILVVDQKSTTTPTIPPEAPEHWWSGFLNFFK